MMNGLHMHADEGGPAFKIMTVCIPHCTPTSVAPSHHPLQLDK